MYKNVFDGKRNPLRSQLRGWWGKLTEGDLDRVAGRYDRFIALLQAKYGYTQERAETEIDDY